VRTTRFWKIPSSGDAQNNFHQVTLKIPSSGDAQNNLHQVTLKAKIFENQII
jgi:hypothetical protein